MTTQEYISEAKFFDNVNQICSSKNMIKGDSYIITTMLSNLPCLLHISKKSGMTVTYLSVASSSYIY